MQSRNSVADAVRRWLMLQQELGGDEIIFDVPIDVRASLAPRADRVTGRNTTPAAVAPPVPMATVAPHPGESLPDAKVPAPVGEKTDWRKGAPPIPGPGLIVTSPIVAGAADWGSLDEIATVVRNCQKCPLGRTRTHAVPGEGNPSAGLFLVGEGPGESEDRSGRPFVGRAGELLDKMLAAIEIPRADAYIANVVKCRPPKNRVPLPDEREACLPYLRRQIELVRPRVLVALGGTAAETLLGVKTSLGQLRLKVHQWNGIPLIVTYHPAALLRNPNWKRPAWDDVRIARQLLDRRA
jgi:DNA polymerase